MSDSVKGSVCSSGAVGDEEEVGDFAAADLAAVSLFEGDVLAGFGGAGALKIVEKFALPDCCWSAGGSVVVPPGKAGNSSLFGTRCTVLRFA